MTDQTITPTLSEQLEQFKQAGATKIPLEVQALREQAIATVARSGIVEQRLTEGDTAPDFTLPNADGTSTTLSTMLAKDPVVLTFYRGEWCPYCNLTLRAYQAALPHFTALGATLIAISPQLPDFSQAMSTKADLTFPVLSDVGNKVAHDYRLVYTMSESIRPYSADLAKYNGDESWELPLAATFVINRDRVIRLAFVSADHRQRLDPTAIIAALEELQ